jgi:TolB protein
MIDNHAEQNTEENARPGYLSTLILIVVGILLIITAVVFYPDARAQMERNRAEAVQPTPTQTSTPTPTSAPAPTTEAEAPNLDLLAYPSQFGSLILSIREGMDIHLFAYQPFLEDWSGVGYTALPLTRITSGPYQDITPAVSPDGSQVAFASNRNGPWDIYILDLNSGEIQQFTDTYAYDGNPTWSPDGAWLAYESYHVNNLEIMIQDINRTSGEIPLTNHPGADFSPNWSKQGRLISFVSTRNGRQEVWYADLDSPEIEKADPLPNLAGITADHPVWSPDGRYLTWSIVTEEGNHSLVSWDSSDPDRAPVLTGSGDWPLWSGGGEVLYSVLEGPYDTYLTAYPGFEGSSQTMLPAVKMPGHVEGISWSAANAFIYQANLDPVPEPTPLWVPAGGTAAEQSAESKDLIQLRNLQAPNPRINEDAVGSFSSLRQAVRNSAGWDFLANLEYAYVPITDPLPPGVSLEWLLTGRGMMTDDIPRRANWLVLVKEDWLDQTYWRVYLRANNQQGTQGKPLHDFNWSFSARYSGNNAQYENGGARSQHIQDGYWIDFTEIADAFGWKRFPAEPFWQFSETASRYQYFAFTQGMSLPAALEQLYSREDILDLNIGANP